MLSLKTFLTKYKNADYMLKATLWFSAVMILNKGVALLTQPIINRILTVEEVGVVSIYLTWSSIFGVLATLNLFGGVLEVQLTNNKEDAKQVVGSLSTLSLLVSVLFFGIVALFIAPISDFLELKPSYLLVMALSVVSQALIQFWCVPKRFRYSYKVYSAVVILLFTCQSVLTVLLSWLFSDDRVLGRIVGLCLPELLLALFFLLKILRETDFKQIAKYWKRGLYTNIPLVPHYLSSIILASSDKIMIQKMTNDAAVGLYTIAYSYAGMGLLVFNAINSAYTPVAFQAIKDRDYLPLRRKTNWLVLVSVLTACMMSLFAPEALYILGGKEYLEVLPIVPSLLVGVFLSCFYYIFSNVEFVYERTKLIFPITFIGSALNVGLNYFLIPIMGYSAAAYTTIAGYLVISLLHYAVSRRIVGMEIYDVKGIALSLLLLVAICAASVFLYTNILLRYSFVVLFATLLLFALKRNQKKEKDT